MSGYVVAPTKWLFALDLTLQDVSRLLRLWWKYDSFVNLSKVRGQVDYLECFYPSQETLCEVLGFSKGSQSRVSKVLKEFESKGYIRRFKTTIRTREGFIPRHFIVVLNPESCYYHEQINQLEKQVCKD